MIAGVLIALLAAMLAAALPWWPWNRRWSLRSAGGIGAALVLVLWLVYERVL